MNAIRPASVSDLDALSRLLDGYRRFYDQTGDVAAARTYLVQRFALGDSRLLVHEANGALTGFVQLYPGLSTVSLGPRWTLADLYVLPEARGQGIGRELMQAATELAVDQGVRRLTLNTQTHNHPAQRLYESLGWQRNDAFHAYTLVID
ncbi:N-acetyltransferase family protein [Halomonas sp. WWR20]